MNSFYKQMNALLFFVAVVTVPMVAMENEVAAEVLSGTTVWYQKRSIQVAAVMTTATAACAFAVRTGRIGLPAILAGIFFAGSTTLATQPDPQDSDFNVQNGKTDKNDETGKVVVVEVLPTSQLAQQLAGLSDAATAFWNKFKDVVTQTTNEDLKDQHLNAFNE